MGTHSTLFVELGLLVQPYLISHIEEFRERSASQNVHHRLSNIPIRSTV